MRSFGLWVSSHSILCSLELAVPAYRVLSLPRRIVFVPFLGGPRQLVVGSGSDGSCSLVGMQLPVPSTRARSRIRIEHLVVRLQSFRKRKTQSSCEG